MSYPQFVLFAVVIFASARVAPSLTSGLSLVSRLINDGIPSAKGKTRNFQVFQNNVWLRLQVTEPKLPRESNFPYATKKTRAETDLYQNVSKQVTFSFANFINVKHWSLQKGCSYKLYHLSLKNRLTNIFFLVKRSTEKVKWVAKSCHKTQNHDSAGAGTQTSQCRAKRAYHLCAVNQLFLLVLTKFSNHISATKVLRHNCKG